MNNQVRYPLAMAENFWRNSQLSIAGFTGSIRVGPHRYTICNEQGKDIYQCSREAELEGREKAIEPGAPCDLVREDVIPIYRKLGREQFLKFCKAFPEMWTLEEVKKNLKLWEQKN